MKKNVISTFLFILILASCANDSTSPNGMAEVKIISNMSSGVIKNHSAKRTILNHNVDSLRVTKLRILISDIKLHGNLENEDKNESFKIGPFVLKADSTNNYYFIAEHSIPVGSYDKIKFEIHKFPESERVHYEGDTLFGEFATKDKFTILIDGYYYEDGLEMPFEFKSNQTENLSIKFDRVIELNDDEVHNLNLYVNPELLFVKDGNIIRPTEENWKEIEKNIHRSIKVIKNHFK